MSVALALLFDRFLCAGLLKCAVGFLMPYQRRINPIAACYAYAATAAATVSMTASPSL